MMFVVLFWIAAVVVVMRLLAWISTRYPKARNIAAFVVALGGTFAFFEAFADAGAAASGFAGSEAHLIERAVLFGLVGAAALYSATTAATSAHVLYPPFVVFGIAALAWLRIPWFRWPIGLGLVGVGWMIAVLKHRRLRSDSSGNAHAASQA